MKVKRETDDLLKPRKYKDSGGYVYTITCVHATVTEHGFAGCFSETHHISVETQGILNTCHVMRIDIEKFKSELKEETTLMLLKGLDQIRDRCDEIKDALTVLKKQTKDKW